MRPSDLVFFLSGAAALGYETVWARLLARVVGSDAPGSAIVFAAFLGGMGAGAFAFAGLARRTRRPVRMFALCELGVAVWAGLTPSLIAAVPPAPGWGVRALLAALLVLPATLLLGATFPLMGRLTIRGAVEAASETSAFYGANTVGAAAGALLAPFVLMPPLGLSGSVYACAALDLVAAGLALALLRDARPREEAPPDPPVSEAGLGFEPLFLATFLLGASALALEVLLLRLVVSVTGASVYAFAIVTGVFLLGLGLGSRQLAERRTRTAGAASALAERSRKSREAVFWAAIALPFLGLAGLLALRYQLGEADLFAGLANRVLSGASLARVWAGHALFAGLVLLPPAIAFGIAFPALAASAIAGASGTSVERTLGRVYAWNTAGSLLGSLGAAFVLLPLAGPRAGVALALVLPLGAALCVMRQRARTVLLAAAAAAVVGTVVLFPRGRPGGPAVLVLAHDAHTTALVEEARTSVGGRVRALRVNGKSEASTATVDVRLQYLLGHVPVLLHGQVERALVVGLGTGMTAGSLLDGPDLHSLRIVEISRSVARAAREFADWNGAVLDDPRTTLSIGDGRHFLATTSERFDLVTSDPVHPWTRGSSDLYTLEHFRNVARVLSERGVASQWLPLYELSPHDVKTIVATWCAAFEHVSAWLTAYDLVLVGSRGPLANEGRLARLQLPARMRAHGEAIGVREGGDVAALLAADDRALRELVPRIEPMRDDRPVIEFAAPRSAMAGYQTEILRWAIRPEFVSALEPAAQARGQAFRLAVERFLEELPAGFTAAADRLGGALADGARGGR